MNKSLDERIKRILFKYINIVFNVSESSGMLFAVQLCNAKDFLYEITFGLERICHSKGMKLYTIDLNFEDLGMNEIDENGNYVLPVWLKREKEHSVILVYNLDNIGNKNYKMRHLKEILTKSAIEGYPVPYTKHFVIVSDKDLKAKSTVMNIDLKKALSLLNRKEKYENIN